MKLNSIIIASLTLVSSTAFADFMVYGTAINSYRGNVTCRAFPQDSAARANAQLQANRACDQIDRSFFAVETLESQNRTGQTARSYFPGEFASPEHVLCKTTIAFSYNCQQR